MLIQFVLDETDIEVDIDEMPALEDVNNDDEDDDYNTQYIQYIIKVQVDTTIKNQILDGTCNRRLLRGPGLVGVSGNARGYRATKSLSVERRFFFGGSIFSLCFSISVAISVASHFSTFLRTPSTTSFGKTSRFFELALFLATSIPRSLRFM